MYVPEQKFDMRCEGLCTCGTGGEIRCTPMCPNAPPPEFKTCGPGEELQLTSKPVGASGRCFCETISCEKQVNDRRRRSVTLDNIKSNQIK